jgi:hypothetical protein
VNIRRSPPVPLNLPRHEANLGNFCLYPDNIKFNSNKSPIRCNSFPVYYPDVYLRLNMFRASSRPSSGAWWLQSQPLVLPTYRGKPARPRTQHDCHHDTKVKPEAATAVIKLLMMGGKTPETCWAVNKRQDNKLENCCIRLGDSFELYDDARTYKR